MLKLVVGVVKMAIKGENLYSTVQGIVENVQTIADPAASTGEKALAALSIVMDVTSGINVKDVKAASSVISSAAEKLPRMKGMGATERAKVLADGGFSRTKVSNSAARNETWSHADKSEVSVHPYGGQRTSPHKSGNNAHIHKRDSSGKDLNDRGKQSSDPNETHIGLPNPVDFPAVRNRQHGD